MRINLPRVRASTPPSAKAEGLFRRALEWIARVKAGEGLDMGPSGFLRDRPEEFDARLVGTANPYTCVEQAGTAGGAWADRAGGASVPCFELNAQAGLAGKVVHVRREGGAWRFAYNRFGYASPPPTCSPCSIPLQDLHLSWTYNKAGGGTNTIALTLIYSAGSPDTWTSHSVTLGGFGNPPPNANPNLPCTYNNLGNSVHQFQVTCDVGIGVQMIHIYYCNSGASQLSGAYNMINSTYSCSPFSADWPLALCSYDDQRMILTA